MINYYYEIHDGVTLFGQEIKYLSIYDVNPGSVVYHSLHDMAIKHSNRVWLENANGISLIKSPISDIGWVNEKELVWLKLICKNIEDIV